MGFLGVSLWLQHIVVLTLLPLCWDCHVTIRFSVVSVKLGCSHHTHRDRFRWNWFHSDWRRHLLSSLLMGFPCPSEWEMVQYLRTPDTPAIQNKFVSHIWQIMISWLVKVWWRKVHHMWDHQAFLEKKLPQVLPGKTQSVQETHVWKLRGSQDEIDHWPQFPNEYNNHNHNYNDNNHGNQTSN